MEQIIIPRLFDKYQLVTFYQKVGFVSSALPLTILVTLFLACITNLLSSSMFKLINVLLDKYINKKHTNLAPNIIK